MGVSPSIKALLSRAFLLLTAIIVTARCTAGRVDIERRSDAAASTFLFIHCLLRANCYVSA